jgi:hypothetical protein
MNVSVTKQLVKTRRSSRPAREGSVLTRALYRIKRQSFGLERRDGLRMRGPPKGSRRSLVERPPAEETGLERR